MKKLLAHVARFARALGRLRRLRKTRPGLYVAQGGPFHGHTLLLTHGDTATLTAGLHHGRYVCAKLAAQGQPGECKWQDEERRGNRAARHMGKPYNREAQ